MALKKFRKSEPFTVVSFYTEDNEYKEHAERLRKSLDQFGINYKLLPIQSRGKWEINCAYKSQFIYNMFNEIDTNIVWVDADATIEAYPEFFERISADFGIHKWDGWQFGSGTIFFRKSENTEKLIQQWVKRCEADPITWDQIHLESAWCDITTSTGLTTEWLPVNYLHIFDAGIDGQPVIKHWQASRKPKIEGLVLDSKPMKLVERGKEDRRSDRLWRTKEESFWISQGVDHIIPKVGYSYPEGFDVGALLKTAIDDLWPVLEVGCGVGRIASLFNENQYLGVEINPNALIQARKALPEYNLRIIDDGYSYPAAPTVLFYTVLLHIPDEKIELLLAEASQGRQRVVIAEIMDSRWRRDGDPPVFNRDPETYILLMQKQGFLLRTYEKKIYKRYNAEPWNIGHDTRLTVLVFDKQS